jgi:uncharacterized membrane protein
MNYLIWYNTENPHRGIGKKPLRYYLEKFATPEKSNMLWPLTVVCVLCAAVLKLPYHKGFVLEKSHLTLLIS